MAQNIEKCDCLNDCGDDHRVMQGLRIPCALYADYKAREVAKTAAVDRVMALAAQAEKHGTVSISAEDMQAIVRLMPAIQRF